MRAYSIMPASFICLLLCSHAFSQRIQKGSLPPDYNCEGCVLVILKKEPEKNIHKLNEMIEARLIKNYDGKSVFITAKDLATDSLYKDENVYRFVLNGEPYDVSGSQTVEKANHRSGEFNYTMTPLSFHLYDRLTKKGYPQISNWASWPKTMTKIAEVLNKLLKK